MSEDFCCYSPHPQSESHVQSSLEQSQSSPHSQLSPQLHSGEQLHLSSVQLQSQPHLHFFVSSIEKDYE